MGTLYGTIDDTSPMWQYAPYGDYYDGAGTSAGDGVRSGWQAWYNVSGFETNAEGGQSSEGSSFHLSSFPHGSATLSFYDERNCLYSDCGTSSRAITSGSGITVYGFSNASYAVLIDGALVARATIILRDDNSVLHTQNSLPNGRHNLTVLVESDGRSNNTFLALDRAVIRYDSASSALTDVVVDNQDTAALAYTGTWDHTHANEQIHGGQPISTTSGDAGASVTYTFDNSVAVAINGTTNFGAGTYTVDLDGQLVDTYNASSVYLVPEVTLFYMAGLDPTQTHNVTMTNNGKLDMRFSSVTSFQLARNATSVPSNTSSSSPTTSATSSPSPTHHGLGSGKRAAAIAVPVIFLLIATATTFLFICCRRRRLRPERGPPVDNPPTPAFHHMETVPEMALRSPTSKRGLDAQALPALPMREAAFTPTVASLHPPTTVLSPESQPVVDVDRLVELIAARMDRSARPDSGLPPPQYQLR